MSRFLGWKGWSRGAAQKMANNMKTYLSAKNSKKFTNKDWAIMRDELGILPLGVNRIELIVLNALAMLAMPYLVWAMASGFVGDPRFDLTVVFGRIAFPYILFISLAALISGVLNSAGRFVAAAAAPVRGPPSGVIRGPCCAPELASSRVPWAQSPLWK